MSAVLLALASAALFGSMTVALRLGLAEGDTSGATLAMLLYALAVGVVASLVDHDYHGAWPFLLAGLLAPGGSQLLFTKAVREAGPSRTSVVVGGAPIVAVAIAVVVLGEALRLPLVLGALAIVAGGVALASERDRPGHVRLRGLAFAAGAAALFATRDNVVRALHGHATPGTAAAATLLAGTALNALFARRAPTGRELRGLAPAGVLFGFSYVLLFEAYFHGPVTVVSPLVATESLWGVACAVIVFGAAEGVGRRLLLGAALVVTGGVLIGAFR